MKPAILKIFYTFLFILGISGAALAQTSVPGGRISGTLLDEHGKPMMFATTSLLNAKDSTIVKGAISNDAGVYVFEHIKDGQYLVKATTVGYDKATSKPFTISQASKSVTVPQIAMQPNDHNLSTVNIVASKPLIEQKSDRVVLNVAGSVLAAGNSAMDILERAPGVSVDKDDNISLKGKQGVTVMLNDKLTYLTSAQLATLLRSTDGNTIQSIEIISNPSAKYDASGNSGIINIKLKKNRQTGTNGSITAGVGYGKNGKDNETFQLNHKEGRLNLFGTFSHNDNKRYQNIGIKRIVTDSVGGQTFFDQFSELPQTNHNNSYRVGADYDISDKNTVGFVVSGYFNSEVDNNTNTTHIGPNFSQVDSSLTTAAVFNQSYHNIAVNLNDTWKLDTAGQQLNIDLDYSKFKNNSNAYYMTNFFLADGSQQHPAAFLGNLTPSNIDIHTAKADYTLPITKSVKFETGVKLSDVKTDNDLQQSVVEGGQYLSVNHFIYDEKIDAGYINFSKDYKNTSVQLGLRGEYTSSNATGDSLNVTQVVSRHYFNLFPSVFINHTINDKNEIGISYSRRIDRPQYDNLNPFVYHLDPYTYQKGNPYLKPQYTNNFELNYTYNKSINLSLGYSRTTDVISEIPGADPKTKIGFVTSQNLQTQINYSANLFAPYTINKWWSGNANVTVFYLGFKSNGLEGANLDRGQTAYQIRANETFTPIKGYRFELTGNYQSALTYALFYVKPQYSVDAGVSHSFLNKKANLKFSVSDIFNMRRNDVTSKYQSVDFDIRQKRETRIARLTFTYNFGSTKIKMRKHETGADDLNNRVKGAN
ncbi:outer membrane beta-barrel family protein [Mucilaginibacter sp.]|jgi:outer membrane receptor protein involved in Fe transport|uniref:outer membrane beta-barrel family protein n=1 Tax=Mucilaginibacter sp. TaxID=1882438 RepID=UPI002C9CFCE8|nr:outer membrane beta-barrel family protein [Mucilaginibacter sp.]HTI60369.1 outer membrane beta-barrel family protein [Mucilaginibacter sp.]